MAQYQDFRHVTSRALDFALTSAGVSVPGDRLHQILGRYDRLPAFPDAKPALQSLTSGFRLVAPLTGSGGQWRAFPPGAAGRGDGIPGLAGGDDGVQLPQDRCRNDGLRLGGREPVLLPADQVLVTGGVDGVSALGSRDRAPGCQPQPGPSPARSAGSCR
jgi:hypothetical protein